MSGPFITPGPWAVHSTNRLIVPLADAHKPVGEVGTRSVDGDDLPHSLAMLRDCDEDISEDESLANGFLMAAAPTMFHALRTLIASCMQTPVLHDGCGTAIIAAPSPEALREASDALRLAEGRP